MTKCIVIGEQPTQEKKKPIEFKKYLDEAGRKDDPATKPKDWGYIELITHNFRNAGNDLMFAYDANKRNTGALYLGHWNDGVAE